MKTLTIMSVILFIFPLFAADYTETRNLNLDCEDIEKLIIDCGAGYLKVTGNKNIDEIEVTARIEIENINTEKAERLLEKYIELSLKARGSRAILTSSFERTESFFSFIFNKNANVTIDLTVEIPEHLHVDIDDGSGFIEIRNLSGDIRIDDGSGDIEIDDSDGDIDIDDGSGDIEIEDVTGEIDIDDGSGDINIKNAKGDIFVDDGSGEIYAVEIDGNIKVDDGSGSININGVEEDVIIEDAGSGSVSIKNVAGKVHRYDD